MISVFFNAPLEGEANPGLSPNPTKAPWYFMGFQEILLHLHPFMALFLIPILMLLSLISIPYFRYPSSTALLSGRGISSGVLSEKSGSIPLLPGRIRPRSLSCGSMASQRSTGAGGIVSLKRGIDLRQGLHLRGGELKDHL